MPRAARQRDDIRLSVTALTDDDPWQRRGKCSQPGALDSYETNPFDAALDTLERDPLLLDLLNRKFCAQCPVMALCENWASVDNYIGLAGGKLWGTKGRRGIPVKNALKKRRR